MILPIYLYGAEVLREQTRNVEKGEGLGTLIADMWETLDNAEGVGLAAPQIGKAIRLLIVDGTPLAEDLSYLSDFKRIMINPEVVEESEEMATYSEGCLSIPDIHLDVTRPERIKVKYMNENFEEVVEEFREYACRIVQHEMDHLNGVMFVDRAAPIRRKMIGSKLFNISKGKVRADYKTKLK